MEVAKMGRPKTYNIRLSEDERATLQKTIRNTHDARTKLLSLYPKFI